MKVLFVSSSSGSRGGGELYLLFLAKALKNLGVEVGMWCSTHTRMDELSESFKDLGVVFRADYKNTYDYTLRSIGHLISLNKPDFARVLNEYQPDIIHLNKQNLEDGLDLIRSLNKLDTPYVTTIHITQTQKSLNAFLGKIRDIVAKKFLENASTKRWIVVSESREKDLAVFLQNKCKIIEYIANGVEVSNDFSINHKIKLRLSLGLPADKTIVLSVGRLEHQKNPKKFLDWAEECLNSNRNCIFYWIGDGSMRSYFYDRVKKAGLSEKIICLGWLKDPTSYYKVADIYLHTANFEGLPFSLLEAMANSLPCVLQESLYNDLKFPKEVLSKGRDKLKYLIENVEDRSELGARAKLFILKNYSINAIAMAYLSMYKSVLND